MKPAAVPLRLTAPREGSRPAAIWRSFAAMSAWKSWFLAASMGLNAVLAVTALGLSKQPPDIVVLSPDGTSSYVERSVATEQLVRYLAELKQEPTEIGAHAFSRRFLQLALAINSSTIEEAWPEALALMGPGLRDKMKSLAERNKLLDTYKLANVRTALEVRELRTMQRVGPLWHLTARVLRKKAGLLDSRAALTDEVEVDLVLQSVARTPQRPDGLELYSWNLREVAAGQAESAQSAFPAEATTHAR